MMANVNMQREFSMQATKLITKPNNDQEEIIHKIKHFPKACKIEHMLYFHNTKRRQIDERILI